MLLYLNSWIDQLRWQRLKADGEAGTDVARSREGILGYCLPGYRDLNTLYLEIIRLAYNLVTAFQQTCVPEEWQTLALSKLRHRLFSLSGELSRPENRPTLRLGKSALVRL